MKLKSILFTSIAALLLITCSEDDTEIDVFANEYSEIELEILDLINEHRNSIDKESLTMDYYIYEVATLHTEDMISTDSMSHDGFYDRYDLIKDSLGNGGMAENVAMGYRTAEAVVNGWLNSSGHKTNIEGNYALTGISAIEDASGSYYYTQIFYTD